MKTSIAAEIVQKALRSSIPTWLDYSPQKIPLVVYDHDDFVFFNHPNPPLDRPEHMTAATAIPINDCMTATIPAAMCESEDTLVSLVYHECFHVYQGENFQFKGDYDFFDVLAFYPELDPAHRALCSAETDILSDRSLSPREQAGYLSALAKGRYDILSKRAGLIEFEKNLERNEGVASFVGQKAQMEIYRVAPDNLSNWYGYSRQYFLGSALCWLFEKLVPSREWQSEIQNGMSLSEFLFQIAPNESLETLKLHDRESQEKAATERILADANAKIENLIRNGATTIRLPESDEIFRSFSPKSLLSLGDGRIIHPEFITVQTPNGQISIQGEMALENYLEKTISFRAVPFQIKEGKLDVASQTINLSLENARLNENGIIEFLEQ